MRVCNLDAVFLVRSMLVWEWGEKKEKEAIRGLNLPWWVISAALPRADSASYRLLPHSFSHQLFLFLQAPNVLVLGIVRQREGSF